MLEKDQSKMMNIDGKRIELQIAGIGIIFASPAFTASIEEGQDYLETDYTTEEQVQSHIQNGTIVGFGTGTSGKFILRFHMGYPSNETIGSSEFKLRLGLRCVGGEVCFRDLYDLMDWYSDCPNEQTLKLPDGIYHVSLCSNRPASGMLGDNQVIDFYLQPLEEPPALAKQGVPVLCF